MKMTSLELMVSDQDFVRPDEQRVQRVHSMSRRLTGVGVDPEDVAQDLLVRELETGQEQGSVAIKHRVVDLRRRQTRELLANEAHERGLIRELKEDLELLSLVTRVLSAMEIYLVYLRFYKDMTFDEIALETLTNKFWVRKALNRCVLRMRREFLRLKGAQR